MMRSLDGEGDAFVEVVRRHEQQGALLARRVGRDVAEDFDLTVADAGPAIGVPRGVRRYLHEARGASERAGDGGAAQESERDERGQLMADERNLMRNVKD